MLIGTSTAVGDFDEDGQLEAFGSINRGSGNLESVFYEYLAFETVFVNAGQQARDVRIADFDGDGNVDYLINVYTDPSDLESFGTLHFGDGAGRVISTTNLTDLRGFGHTMLSVDFDNDGAIDLFNPVYTYPGRSPSNYLHFNRFDQGEGFGPNVAIEWGVGLIGNERDFQVEGAEATDVNFDGKIDFFLASHLAINRGDRFDVTVLDRKEFDEGLVLGDFNNDGVFDLTLFTVNEGPVLYLSESGKFVRQGPLDSRDYGGRLMSGIVSADIDANGWEDLVTPTLSGLAVYLNGPDGFQRQNIAASSSDVAYDRLALGDFDGNGTLDMVARSLSWSYVYNNELTGLDPVKISMLSATGAENQFGRTLRFTSLDDPVDRFVRSVDGGAGFLSQGQYDLLTGLPTEGPYQVEAFFADRVVTFRVSRGDDADVYEDGRVIVNGTLVASSTTALDTILDDGSRRITGTTSDDLLTTAGPADTVAGLGGNDRYVLHAADTVIVEDPSGGDDRIIVTAQAGRYQLTERASVEHLEAERGTAPIELIGNELAQTLTGNDGSNLLNGNGAMDTLAGLGGDDRYIVSAADTVIFETFTGGTDRVIVTAQAGSYKLSQAAWIEEIEAESGTAAIYLIGNGLAQTLTGNDGNNLLNGNGGADTLAGLGGNDIYAIADRDAVIVEDAGKGYDTVSTHVSYTLTGTAEIEELAFATAAGTEDMVIIGNGFDQKVIGNFGNNVLNGNGGVDTLIGLMGNDVYVVGNARSVLIEHADQGYDVVFASASYALGKGVSVEVLSTQTAAETRAMNLSGNEVAQLVIGNMGANNLDGGAGADTLRGLGGADTFQFSTPLGAGNVDMIVDLESEIDRIALDAKVFTNLQPGQLVAAAFVTGAAATTADHRIVFNQTTGELLYDADGSGAGAATLFATLAGGTVLTANMIVVV